MRLTIFRIFVTFKFLKNALIEIVFPMLDMFEQIKNPVKDEFKCFDKAYEKALSTSNPVLSEIYANIKNNKGKQLRPILALLCAKAIGVVSENTIKTAVILELLHNVSLIHDDVVDEAEMRRGKPSVNKVFGNKIAVLSGDYLLAQIFEHTADIDDKRIVCAYSQLGKDLSDGEILETITSSQVLKDVSKYIEIIQKKTAVLFSTSLYVGALSSGNLQEEEAQKMREFGNYLGLCFQIKDDIFDYQADSKDIGKPVGADILGKKVTLPVICAYQNASKGDRRDVETRLLKQHLDKEDVNFFLDFVRWNEGIQGAERRMEEFRKKAELLLDGFRPSDAIDSLKLVTHYIIDRKS